MAEVAVGRTCPTCGFGTITYAGNKSDALLTAGCYVCKGTFTTGNPEYVAITPTKCPNCGEVKVPVAPDTGETVNPDTPPPSVGGDVV